MPTSDPREIRFDGVRVRYDSAKSYDELVAALLAESASSPSRSTRSAKRQPAGTRMSSGFNPTSGQADSCYSTCSIMAAGSPRAGIDRKVLRVILGNPLIAITMLRHDVTAGLFAPVEVLLVDEPDGHSSLTYVKPSSLMVIEPNAELLSAATELDAKLAALAAKVTSG